MKSDVVILGVYAADLVFQAERMPKLGETPLGRGFAISSGGKGSNQAVAAARAGAATAFVTRVGADSFGEQARALWAAEGIAVEGVVVDSEAATKRSTESPAAPRSRPPSRGFRGSGF